MAIGITNNQPWTHGEWFGPNERLNTTFQPYADMFDEWERISKEGILSPEMVDTVLGNYRKSMQPGLESSRARVSADVSKRLGSRSGAAAKSIYNQVDMPAIHAESEFAGNLHQQNVESMMSGMKGMGDTYGNMMNLLMNIGKMYEAQQGRMANLGIAEMNSSGGGFGWGDIIQLLPMVGKAIGLGGGGGDSAPETWA